MNSFHHHLVAGSGYCVWPKGGVGILMLTSQHHDPPTTETHFLQPLFLPTLLYFLKNNVLLYNLFYVKSKQHEWVVEQILLTENCELSHKHLVYNLSGKKKKKTENSYQIRMQTW